MMENIEIFDGTGSNKIRRRRHGSYFHVNTKHRAILMSNDAKIAIFGLERANPSKLIVVHSKIERKWYVAEPANNLFGNGFEAKPKDPNNRTSVWTVGSPCVDVFKKMIAEMNGGTINETHVVSLIEDPIEYEGMKLFPLELNQ